MPINKGNFSCHSFTEEGRARYDNMNWNSKKEPSWKETHRLQKQHQEICKSVSKRHTHQCPSNVSMPPAHENAVEYRDVKTTVPHSLIDFTVRPSCVPVEPDCGLTAYDMMIEADLSRN